MIPITDIYGRKASNGEINWVTAIAMTIFHLGAVAAFFYFDWGAVAMAVFLWWVAGSLGIGMCYHRLLTHRGYKTPKWMEYFLTICGTLALEGGPIFWVATHRIHHQYSDHEGDPHTPREGTYWAHMGWIMTGKAMHHDTEVLARYAPDLSKDPFHVALTRWHWVPNVVVGLALLAFGPPPQYWMPMGWSLVRSVPRLVTMPALSLPFASTVPPAAQLQVRPFTPPPLAVSPPDPGALMMLSMACVPSWQDRQARDTEPTASTEPSRVVELAVE